jgi:hypothetical protein
MTILVIVAKFGVAVRFSLPHVRWGTGGLGVEYPTSPITSVTCERGFR